MRPEVYPGVFSLYSVHQGARLQQTYQSIIHNKSFFLAGKLIAIPYQMLEDFPIDTRALHLDKGAEKGYTIDQY